MDLINSRSGGWEKLLILMLLMIVVLFYGRSKEHAKVIYGRSTDTLTAWRTHHSISDDTILFNRIY
jgi:hypothetical protein